MAQKTSLISISIVIPTRQRLQTLRWCLASVLSQDYESLEIIVSDNASTDGTAQYVTSLQDARLRYVNTGRRIGMSQNWEFGLSHASGQWIGFLGDDDGLLPDACHQLNLLIKNYPDIRAIRTRACSYIWPSAQPDGLNLPMNVPLGNAVQLRDGPLWIRKAANASVNYSELPMIYNGGFVQRTLLTEFIKQHGRVFRSRIPDVYSGVLIAHLAGKYLYSCAPIAINGTSAFSTGYAQFRKASSDSQTSDPARAFAQEENLPFHPSIPLRENGDIPKSILALLYESMCQLSLCFPDIHLPSPVQMARYVAAAPHSMSQEDLTAWLLSFRKMHGLPHAYPLNPGNLQRFWFRVKFLLYRLGLVWNSHFSRTDQPALDNIHEAAAAARDIYSKKKPSRFHVLHHVLRQYRHARTSR